MNTELIAVLEHMEREKGVSRSVLIDAISSALESAARRILNDKEAEVLVSIDQLTGEISVTADGEKLSSKEFGRIAAQTAKQVIIQKIRDAERDVIFEEFNPKQHSIVSGTVFRYDKGTVIIDLGKTEAVLPKREQSPRDVYRQGDRVRALIVEVNTGIKGPQIIVSRTHQDFVKKLFEVEVPEVLDAIVEIKRVAREPGDRSKVAVWSKDEKIDCVGACVGMRGSRVKNIVRELHGEKLDIVRWSENATEYIKAALSPAQCEHIEILDIEERKARVIVDDEQLSLAIGKNGQNVRLASKLTGWSIDIKSKTELANEQLSGGDNAQIGADQKNASSIPCVDDEIANALKGAGIVTVMQLFELGLNALTRVDGVSQEKAHEIWQAVESDPAVQAAKESAAEQTAQEGHGVDGSSAEDGAEIANASSDESAEPASDTNEERESSKEQEA